MSKKQKLTYSQSVELNRANLAARDETNAASQLCAQIIPLRERVAAAIAYGQACEDAAQESSLSLLSYDDLCVLRDDVYSRMATMVEIEYCREIDAEIKRRNTEPVAPIAFWRIALPILREHE